MGDLGRAHGAHEIVQVGHERVGAQGIEDAVAFPSALDESSHIENGQLITVY
jgi:hypothetical protein